MTNEQNLNNEKQIYKGYIITKDKKPLMKYTGEDIKLMTLEHVTQANYQEYSGVLQNDIVLIDVDDNEQAKTMLSIVINYNLYTKVYETNRGLHFIFKNSAFNDNGNRAFNQPYTKILLACGIVADIKVGCKNSIEVLKYNDVLRNVVYDKKDRNGRYDEVPFFFYHFKHDKLDKNTILFPIREGERNDILYEYKLALYRYFKQSFKKDQYKTILQIVNNYICETPLNEQEFKVIARYENETKGINKELSQAKNVNKPSEANQKMNEYELALYIVNTKCVNFINYQQQLFVYENNYYTCDEYAIERAFNYISSVLHEYIPMQKREYLRKQLLTILPNIDDIKTNFINFKNGLYDVFNNKFLGLHTPKIITFNQIPHNYKENLNVEDNEIYKNVEKFFNDLTCNNKDIKTLLYEAIGYTMTTNKSLRKMFILHGGKANGKSTFLKMLKFVIGAKNTTALCFKDIDKKFSLVDINKKLLSVGDDIENKPISNTGTLKKIVSGDNIRVEQKCQPSFVMTPYATLFFSCNQIPHIKNDETGAMLSRIIYIPFHNFFKPSTTFVKWFNDNILYNEQAMEYIVSKSVQHLQQLLSVDEFTQCLAVKKLHSKQSIKNSSISTFVDDRGYSRNDFINQPIKVFYEEYIKYIDSLFEDEDDRQSVQKESIRNFSKYIRNNYNLSSKQRKIKQDNGLLKNCKVFSALE